MENGQNPLSSETRPVDETTLGSVLSELRWGDRWLDHKSMSAGRKIKPARGGGSTFGEEVSGRDFPIAALLRDLKQGSWSMWMLGD